MKILYKPNCYSQQRQRDKRAWVYPVLMAMQAEWHWEHGDMVSWDVGDEIQFDKVIREPEAIPFLELPAPDRVFTNAFDKRFQRNGNYKHRPATHMQVADGCLHGKCSFCVENKKTYSVRPMKEVIDEIDLCIKQGFKEIFDDSGTFPVWDFLYEFCDNIKKRDVIFGCNMRINRGIDYKRMKEAGFRMVLFGVESFNQGTLDKLNKGINVNDIIPCLERASRAGLEPHVCIITSYPWETYKEEKHTIDKVVWLLRKGIAKTAQASVYDVPNSPIYNKELKNKIYNCAFYPDFWFNKLKDIKNFTDAMYLLKSIRKGVIRD